MPVAAGLSSRYVSTSTGLLKLAVIGSTIGAALVSIFLVYLHYSAVGLVWTLVLSTGGSILAAALWGLLSAIVGDLLLALSGFVVWPLSALGIYLLLGVAAD